MGTTTFSGPIKAGTIKDTTGSAAGTNVANTGFVLMAQTAVVDIAGVSATTTVATIPANAKIVDVKLNVVQANDNAAAATLSVGFSTGDATLLDATNVKVVGLTSSSAMGTASINLNHFTAIDHTLIATFTPTPTATGTNGIADVTVSYLQNTDIDIVI